MLTDVVRRSFWLGIGAAAGRLLPLLVLVAAGRHMETRQFASASAAYAWAGVATALTSAGLAIVMTQQLAGVSAPELRRSIFGHHLRLSLLFSSLLAAAVLVGGQWGARRVFGAAFEPVVVIPAALSGALWPQVTLCVAALNGCHRARAASGLLASCGLLQGASMAAALLVTGTDARALSWGVFIGNALSCALAFAWLARALQIRSWMPPSAGLFVAASQARSSRNSIIWLSVASGLVLPVGFFASSLISHGADGARQLAQYFALEQLHQALVYVPAIIGQALLPIISRDLMQLEDGTRRARLLQRIARAALITAALGIAIGALLTLGVDWLVILVNNPAVGVHDRWAVRFMVMNAALGVSLSITGGAILGSGKIVAAGVSNLSWSLVFVGLTVLFSTHGNLGLQLARFVASAVLALTASAILFQVSKHTLQLTQRKSVVPSQP
jgi:O-antigen/teichoic acid export membrane protein